LSRRYWITSPWKSRCSLVTFVSTATSNAHSASRCQRRDNACEVEFLIDYEFRSRTLGFLMGAMFEAAFRRFATAFERRADEVYGTA
jgi:hypothetical protein